jgi:hypothetical protein
MPPEFEGQQGTAQPGSDPGQGQPPDSPAGTTGETAPEAETDESGRPLPFNEHPKWKSARQAEKALDGLLKANDLDSIEDLVDLVNSGKALVGKGIDPEALDGLLDKATEMDAVKEYWASQREAQRREQESPDETAERLARENADLKKKLSGQDAATASKRALDTFEKQSRSFIDEAGKDLDKEEKDALAFLMGLDHPFAEIDITNPIQIKKMGKQVLKVVEGIEQRAIRKYVDGKKKLPNVGSSTTPAAPAPKGITNLRDARTALKEQLKSMFTQ